MQTTTIRIDMQVKTLLQGFGRKGETYNEILKRIIEMAQYAHFMDQQYGILKSEKSWVPMSDL